MKCSALSQGQSCALAIPTTWGAPSPPTHHYWSKPSAPSESSGNSNPSTELPLRLPLPQVRHDVTVLRNPTALSLYLTYATFYSELVICICGLIPFARLEAPGGMIKYTYLC